jgi:DNA-binding NarL/FixJ family response regulator
MPPIIVMTDEGKIVFQNVLENPEELIEHLQGNGAIPGISENCPRVKINSLIVLTDQEPENKPDVPKLSMRQASVLQLLSNGYSPEQIALKLNLSMPTIRLHMTKLKEKFGTSSRDQMMAMAGQMELCNPFEDLTEK